MQSFNTLASLCSWADKLDASLVGPLVDRIARDKAQPYTQSQYKGTFVFYFSFT